MADQPSRRLIISRQKNRALPWHVEIESWPAEERDWGWLAGGSMILVDAADESLAPALARVRAAVQASGESPEALFGEPVAYGRATGKALRPAVQILEPTWLPGRLGGLAKVLCAGTGAMLLILGCWLGFDDGWAERGFDGPVMLLFPIAYLLCCAVMWGWMLRTRGHLGAAAITWLGSLLGACGSIWLVSSLPEDSIAAPANWVVAAGGAVLIAIGLLPPWPKERVLMADAHWDDERWFRQAANLLRGRYLFSRAQADAALHEARDHRKLSGSAEPASDEFGNVEVFTAHLAAAHPPAIRRGVVLRRVGWLLALLGYAGVMLVPQLIEDGPSWLTGTMSVIIVVLVIGTLRDLRPTKLDEAAAEKAMTRTSDAQSLDLHSPDDPDDPQPPRD